MDKFLEKVKDILYHFFDYIFIALVMIFIGLIINWRLGMMFDRNQAEVNGNIDSPSQIENIDSKDDIEDKKEARKDNSPTKVINITIPKGSVSSDIAEILEEANLIDNIDDFEDKVYELDLASSLKPGDFEFEPGASLEDIVKEISK